MSSTIPNATNVGIKKTMDKKIEEQIANIRAALKKDEAERKKHVKNFEAITKLQSREKDLVALIDSYTEDLAEVQKEIAERVLLNFDFSDPITTKAVKATLRKLIKDNK